MIKSKVVCNFFPGATSKYFVHYIKPTLQENEFDTSNLHMGVNDVLKLGSNIDTVSKDINLANHCKNFVVKQIISGLTLTAWLNARFIQLLNNSIQQFKFVAKKHNLSCKNLWQDGLHLNNSGKGVLLNNYVVTLNDNYF